MSSWRCDSLSRVHFSRQLRRGIADDARTMEEREKGPRTDATLFFKLPPSFRPLPALLLCKPGSELTSEHTSGYRAPSFEHDLPACWRRRNTPTSRREERRRHRLRIASITRSHAPSAPRRPTLSSPSTPACCRADVSSERLACVLPLHLRCAMSSNMTNAQL
jgi:hypothetical protein